MKPNSYSNDEMGPSAGTGNSAGFLIQIFNAALAAVDPYRAVLDRVRLNHGHLQTGDASLDLAAFDRIIVVGAGKATARMALAIEALLGKRISAGLIVVKEGHTAPLEIIEQVEAAHPVPDESGQAAAKRILEMVRATDEKTLVICLFSGGASALLVLPVDGVTLQDKQAATRLLLKAGASIDELNAVRKHLSAVKGGRLSQAAYPAQIVTLLLSDVIGDRLDVIASGPTAPDGSTFEYAKSVIAKYRLAESMPPRVIDCLEKGISGQLPETVKYGDCCFSRTHNVIIGTLNSALVAAQQMSIQLGVPAKIISTEFQGEARDAAHALAQVARETLAGMQPGERCCLLCGGETTVTVAGKGNGGRNQELALAFALEIAGLDGITLLSAGTDGSDGPTDAAGAVVDGQTAVRAREFGIDLASYLADNDSCTFFRRYDERSGSHSHLITGPTGTNVMDVQLLLLGKV